MMPDRDEIRTSKMPIYASATVVRETKTPRARSTSARTSPSLHQTSSASSTERELLLKIGQRCWRQLRDYELSRFYESFRNEFIQPDPILVKYCKLLFLCAEIISKNTRSFWEY